MKGYFRFLSKGERVSEQGQARRSKLGVYKQATFNHWEKEQDCSAMLVSSSVNFSAVQAQGKDDPAIWAHSSDHKFILPPPSKPSPALTF